MKLNNLSTSYSNLNGEVSNKKKEKRLFRCGSVFMTTRVGEKARTDEQFRIFIDKSLTRHKAGDWGEVPSQDARSLDERF